MYQRIITLLGIICIWATLTGCAALPADVPPYMVMLTPYYPTLEGRCTGAILGPHTVLTARHCALSKVALDRVLTVYGQEARVISATVSLDADVALLYTDRDLYTHQYGKLGTAQPGTVGELWGQCPYYFGFQARPAFYNGLVDLQRIDNSTITLGEWFMLPVFGDTQGEACGGDSGGFLLQGGKIVGVTSAVDSELWFIAIGAHLFTVPSYEVAGLLSD